MVSDWSSYSRWPYRFAHLATGKFPLSRAERRGIGAHGGSLKLFNSGLSYHRDIGFETRDDFQKRDKREQKNKEMVKS